MTDTRFPCWRIRTYEKFHGKWQPSWFGMHWAQDMVYVFERSEEVIINEVMNKVDQILLRADQYESVLVEIRYFMNEEDFRR